MSELKDKKILLIAARFFGYESEIRSRLIQLGAKVDYFDQRPSNSFMTKALIRVNKNFLSRTINAYYVSLIEEIKKVKYDYILFISPEVITKDAFLRLKNIQPDACYVLYMWDSVRNKGKNIHDIIEYFDHRFSFDKGDCENVEWRIRYRPLFFLNEYASVRDNTSREYDLLFIGTIHSDRYRILGDLRAFCDSKKLSYFYYMFFPSKLLFRLRQLIDPLLRKATTQEFRFHAMNKNEILEYMEKSKVVVDVQHPQQTGLTMRTIEVLGARRKLITTNKDIVNYDFYNPQNILLVDRDNIKIDDSFFGTPMAKLPPEIYTKYSIDGWISDLFSPVNE